MYKIQMLLQRVACFLMIVASALVFLYSLGMVTDLYDNKFNYYAETLKNKTPGTEEYANAIAKVKVTGSEIFYDIQPFNKQLTIVALVMIILAVALLVLQNHTRRRYYLVNYVIVGVNAAASIGVTVWALPKIIAYKEQFLQVDFDKLAEMAQIYSHEWTDSTFWFDIAYVVFGVAILAALFLVFTTLYKVAVMNAEKSALAASARKMKKGA